MPRQCVVQATTAVAGSVSGMHQMLDANTVESYTPQHDNMYGIRGALNKQTTVCPDTIWKQVNIEDRRLIGFASAVTVRGDTLQGIYEGSV